MFEVNPSAGHRLLAPRIAYLVGSVGSGGPNLIPVSNVTSVSRDPQVIVVAVYKEWDTYANLVTASGFTLSVPHLRHNDAFWRLGAKYSHFVPPAPKTKLEACGATLDLEASSHGPVLSDGIGWLECQLLEQASIESDHGIFFGAVTRAFFNPEFLTEEGRYLTNSQPVMQVVGNSFSSSSDHWQNEYL